MLYEVKITARVYVSVEAGSEKAAAEVVRDHVCNDWLLRYVESARDKVGHFSVKGLSGEVTSVQPWIGNRTMRKGEGGDEGTD